MFDAGNRNPVAPDAGHMLPGKGRIDVTDLSVTYDGIGGTTLALAPTSLTLQPGTFTALVGPSGCGKSTILNVVAGFVKPTSGSVFVDGAVVKEPSPEVGVIFQQYALFPWFTALGNVMFAMHRFGLAAADRKRKAMDYLAEVGLEKAGGKYPGQLSGGMKQRVAIARTLAGQPNVLLMDEPFGALDAQTRLSMHELLLRVWDAHRATVLFVTHDVDEALLLADTVHVMANNPGRIIKTYHVQAKRPRSVARFDRETLDYREDIITLLHPSNAV